MLRNCFSVACSLVFAWSFCSSAFAEDAPKPAAPSEAEVKAMSEKLVGKFHLYSQAKKENDQNVIDMYDLLLSQKSKKNPEEFMRDLNVLAIRMGETNLKNMKLLGVDSEILRQSSELGNLYSQAGNMEKACERWKEGREFALKLGFSAKADEINGKLAACQNKAP